MRVLFVTSMHPTPANPRRGVMVRRLGEALRALGHDVELFPLGHEGGPLRYLRARPKVAAAVRRYAPDVVHVHFGYSGLAVPALAVPVVTSFYGDDLQGEWTDGGGRTVKSRIGVLISQLVALRSTRCIAVSETLRDRLWLSATRRKTAVVRDAVDVRLFRPRPRDEARARLGLPADDVLVLFPHDATQANKRLWLAQAAVQQLQASEPRARLWVVNGQAPDDMPWYYAAADVMIVTSALEGGPSSAKEALACGVPVVSVAVGDLQLFEEAGEGMIRAVDRPGELAAALRRALGGSANPRRSLLPPGGMVGGGGLTLPEAAAAITAVYRDAVAAAHGSRT